MSKKQQKQRKRDKEVRIILCAVLLLFVILACSSVRLYQKRADYDAQIQQTEQRLASEEARSEEIDAYEEYVSTDEYVEQTARERLGLAYPNEVLLRPEE